MTVPPAPADLPEILGRPTLLTTDLDAQLCFALYSATNSVVRAYRPLLERVGLTYSQYLIMLVLWHEGPQTVSVLADRLKLPASAVSPMLERMQAADLLRRERDANDRRVVHVVLTEAGLALDAAVADAQRDVACQTTLEHDEIVRVRASLHDLVERMTAARTSGDGPLPDA